VTVDDFTNNGSISEGKMAHGGCENAAWFYKPACSINGGSINGFRLYSLPKKVDMDVLKRNRSPYLSISFPHLRIWNGHGKDMDSSSFSTHP
jgi:hypothetical protein